MVDGVTSEIGNSNAGVSQGSNLGPNRFIIYINNISQNLEGSITHLCR